MNNISPEKCFKHRSNDGFTLVELLIVITVIAILAAITIVAYGGVTGQAKLVTLKSALDDANSAIGADIASTNLIQPTGFPSSLSASSGIVLELTVPSSSTQAGYCVNGYRTDINAVWSYNADGGLAQALCPYSTSIATLGGSVPALPTGVNLAPDFRYWTQTGPTSTASYDSSSDTFTVNNNAGAATYFTSPPIRVTNATIVTFSIQGYATTAATTFSPAGGFYGDISYYAADCQTPVNNPVYQPAHNYTLNGYAYSLSPLNQWVTSGGHAYSLKQSSSSPSVVQCVTFTLVAGTSTPYTSNGTQLKGFTATITY